MISDDIEYFGLVALLIFGICLFIFLLFNTTRVDIMCVYCNKKIYNHLIFRTPAKVKIKCPNCSKKINVNDGISYLKEVEREESYDMVCPYCKTFATSRASNLSDMYICKNCSRSYRGKVAKKWFRKYRFKMFVAEVETIEKKLTTPTKRKKKRYNQAEESLSEKIERVIILGFILILLVYYLIFIK